MPFSITAPIKISNIEKEALEYIVKIGSETIGIRAKIVLELQTGKSFAEIKKEIGVSGSVVNRWRNRWLLSELTPQNWDDAIAKIEEILGTGVGRPKKVKFTTEISKIVELSEWSKDRKPCRSKHQHNKQVAEAAKLKGLPEMSPRTIGRLLENNKKEELILNISNR